MRNLLFTFMCFISSSYALTGGPAQPEFRDFESVENTDMVNLATGDFTYSIPIINVPGPGMSYPMALSYHAGIRTEQEASWVGLGWSLNPGAINRDVNKIPDDFDGELIIEEMPTKHIYGWNASLMVNGATVGLTYNSEMGYGGVLGYSWKIGDVGVGVNVGLDRKGFSSVETSLSMGVGRVGLGWDKRSGLGFSGGLGLSLAVASSDLKVGGSLGFDSRYGVQGSVGLSLSEAATKGSASLASVGASLSRSGLSGSVRTAVTMENSISVKGSVRQTSSSFFVPFFIPGIGYGQVNWGEWDIWMTGREENLHYGYLNTGKLSPSSGTCDGTNCAYTMQELSRKSVFDLVFEKPEKVLRLMEASVARQSLKNQNNGRLVLGSTTPDIYSISGQGINGSFEPVNLEDQDYYESNGNESDGTYTATRYWFFEVPRGRNFNDVEFYEGQHLKGQSRNQQAHQNSLIWKWKGELGGSIEEEMDRNALATEYSANRISPKIDPAQKRIVGWQIIKTDGTKYTYDFPLASLGTIVSSKSIEESDATTQKTPSYAYSWLLTEIRGPGNTEGQGVKFHYSNRKAVYWKVPFTQNDWDCKDKNCHKIEGVKEVAYLEKIETPTHIAQFYLSPRDDGKYNSSNIQVSSAGPILNDTYYQPQGIGSVRRMLSTYSLACINEDYPLFESDFRVAIKSSDKTVNINYITHKTIYNNYIMSKYNFSISNPVVNGWCTNQTPLSLFGKNGYVREDLTYNSDENQSMKLDSVITYRKENNEPTQKVAFEYDYSLSPNTPNSYAVNKGKLTLKSIKTSNDGDHYINAYRFEYGNNVPYNMNQKDWAGLNGSTGLGADAWSLNKIISGVRQMNIAYEPKYYQISPEDVNSLKNLDPNYFNGMISKFSEDVIKRNFAHIGTFEQKECQVINATETKKTSVLSNTSRVSYSCPSGYESMTHDQCFKLSNLANCQSSSIDILKNLIGISSTTTCSEPIIVPLNDEILKKYSYHFSGGGSTFTSVTNTSIFSTFDHIYSCENGARVNANLKLGFNVKLNEFYGGGIRVGYIENTDLSTQKGTKISYSYADGYIPRIANSTGLIPFEEIIAEYINPDYSSALGFSQYAGNRSVYYGKVEVKSTIKNSTEDYGKVVYRFITPHDLPVYMSNPDDYSIKVIDPSAFWASMIEKKELDKNGRTVRFEKPRYYFQSLDYPTLYTQNLPLERVDRIPSNQSQFNMGKTVKSAAFLNAYGCGNTLSCWQGGLVAIGVKKIELVPVRHSTEMWVDGVISGDTTDQFDYKSGQAIVSHEANSLGERVVHTKMMAYHIYNQANEFAYLNMLEQVLVSMTYAGTGSDFPISYLKTMQPWDQSNLNKLLDLSYTLWGWADGNGIVQFNDMSLIGDHKSFARVPKIIGEYKWSGVGTPSMLDFTNQSVPMHSNVSGWRTAGLNTRFSPYGQVLEYLSLGNDTNENIYNSQHFSNNFELTLSYANNARFDEYYTTSFEPEDDAAFLIPEYFQAIRNFMDTEVHRSSMSRSGRYGFAMNRGSGGFGITDLIVNPNRSYDVTVWYMGSAPDFKVNNVSGIPTGRTDGRWREYKVSISGLSKMNVSLNIQADPWGAFDDLRIVPRGSFVTTYQYDDKGRIYSTEQANGKVVFYSYDKNGSLMAIRDQSGRVLSERAIIKAGEN